MKDGKQNRLRGHAQIREEGLELEYHGLAPRFQGYVCIIMTAKQTGHRVERMC